MRKTLVSAGQRSVVSTSFSVSRRKGRHTSQQLRPSRATAPDATIGRPSCHNSATNKIQKKSNDGAWAGRVMASKMAAAKS